MLQLNRNVHYELEAQHKVGYIIAFRSTVLNPAQPIFYDDITPQKDQQAFK